MTRAALASLRPRQWSKNLLLFAGLIFAAKLGDGHRWLEAVAIFVAYCAASSASYLVNDVRDAEGDRLHPVKRNRPVARGELPARRALALAAALAAVAVVVAAALGFASLLFLLAFLALQVVYSLGLKHVVLLDVAVIAGLFVVRAAAGAAAVDVRISPWLLVCTAPVVTTATVAAYAVYTVTTHTAWLALTIPFVVFGLARYLALVHRHELGEEPENVLLRDPQILACVAAWAVVSAAILALT